MDTIDNLIDTIRAAVATDASDEARVAGAQACRTILSALETKQGEPLALTAPSPLTAIASVLRGMTPDQMLDLAIARLKAAVPAGADAAPASPLKFHIIQLPPSTGRP